MRRFDAISFDIDQTLIDFAAMRKRALQAVSGQLAAQFGVAISAAGLQAARDRVAAASPNTTRPMLEMRRQSFERILVRAGKAPRHAEALLETFTAARFGAVQFMPGALDLLAALPDDIKKIALTNGNSDPRKLGFGGHFDTVILGEAYPFKKPDKRLFLAALAAAGLGDARRVLHVGDSLVNDVQGANGAGMVSVWYNPKRRPSHGSIRAAHCVVHLREVSDILSAGVIKDCKAARAGVE